MTGTRGRRAGTAVVLAAALVASGCDAPPREGPREPDTTSRPAAADSAVSPGRLVLVGGALQDDNEAVYGAILVGREGDGPLCVLPTASASPGRSMEGYVEVFDRHGGPGTARGLAFTVDEPERARSPEAVRDLRGCAGFFFTGGNQSRIVELFLPKGRETPAFRALRERFRAGAVMAGSSAGAAVLSDPMIAGGSSVGALREGIRAGDEGDGVWLRRGFGFFGPGIVDQHFLARGRLGRLLVAVLARDGIDWGFGVDENTALVVDGHEARVVGESAVLWIDASGAIAARDGPAGSGIRLTLLSRGDRLDLATGEVSVPADKGPVEVRAAEVAVPSDPFARWAFLRLLADFAASPAAEVVVRGNGYSLFLEKPDAFRVRSFGPGGVEGTPLGLHAGPVLLDLVRAE